MVKIKYLLLLGLVVFGLVFAGCSNNTNSTNSAAVSNTSSNVNTNSQVNEEVTNVVNSTLAPIEAADKDVEIGELI